MKSIETVLDGFLQEQKQRLKPRTYRQYEEVIMFYCDYLNGYAWQYLDKDETAAFDERFKVDEEAFVRLFGVDKLTSFSFSNFLDDFVIRKVMSGASFMKQALRVMKKLADWLYENQHIDEEEYSDMKDSIEESKELPDMEKLADLLTDHASKSPDIPFEDELDDYFSVSSVQEGKLWLDEELGLETDIGPVLVSKEISDLCQEGWKINLVIGKAAKGWYILESGFVYPD